MDIGLILPNTGRLVSRDLLFAAADMGEQAGFASLWTADHLVFPTSPAPAGPSGGRGHTVRMDPDHPVYEPLTVLAAIAARTRTVRLGISILILPLRNPILAAKTIATLDQLSGGRVICGIGLGWIAEEYELLGAPWAERGAYLDEQIACLQALWTEQRPAHHGRWHQFSEVGFQPKPAQARLPIWVGGNTPPAMRRAARLGDGWHLSNIAVEELEQRLEGFHRLCRGPGRSPDDVPLSMRLTVKLTGQSAGPADGEPPLTGTPAQIIATLRRYEALGLRHAALALTPYAQTPEEYLDGVRMIAREILPALGAAH